MVKRDRVFQTIDHIILFLVAAFCVLPLVLLFSSSLSNETAVLREGYNILPRGFDRLWVYCKRSQRDSALLRNIGFGHFGGNIGESVYHGPVCLSHFKERHEGEDIFLFYPLLFHPV